MENGGRKIKTIRLFKCGYCVNNLHQIIKKSPRKKIEFPALSVYLEHEKYGNILFDTGYSEAIYKNGLVSKIYNLLNKTYIDSCNQIDNKLCENQINKIDKIIISHAHPDHIAGLKFFNEYELITTDDVAKSIKKASLKNLVFKNLIPSGSARIKTVKLYEGEHFLKKYFSEIYDVLGDGSIIGVRLDGHSKGQMGLYLAEYKLFLAADSCWGENFLNCSKDMKFIPRKIQNDFKAYIENIENIKELKRDFPEINVIFSHGNFEEGIYGK